MGGHDKGLLPLHGRPLIRHVIDRIRPQTAGVRINANRHLATYGEYGHVVPDAADLPANGGPLVGVASGLRVCRTDWLLIVPCDAPWLPRDLALRLWQAAQEAHARAALAVTRQRRHPVCLLVHRSLEPDLTRWLRAGGRKADQWLHSLPAAEARFADEAGFANLNGPDDLANAERALTVQCNQRPNG